MRRPSQVAAICACLPVLCAAGVLASCGGGDDQPARGRAVTVPASRGVTITAREYSFDPAKVVVTGGGGALRVTLRNRGSLAHDVRVLKAGRDLGGTQSFEGKRPHTATVDLKPGRYRLICSVGDHAKLGMRASLEVKR
jgi:plastocyanin